MPNRRPAPHAAAGVPRRRRVRHARLAAGARRVRTPRGLAVRRGGGAAAAKQREQPRCRSAAARHHLPGA
jgi:hypothetical protein